MKATHPCLHCRVYRHVWRSGLCTACARIPEVRLLYRGEPKRFAPRGLSDFNGGNRPKRPTRHRPGTAEKLRVMEERAARGELLFHALDAPMDDEDDDSRVAVMAKGRHPEPCRVTCDDDQDEE